MNRITGIPDFIGDPQVVTVSQSGKADLVNCYKCPSCGYCITRGGKRGV